MSRSDRLLSHRHLPLCAAHLGAWVALGPLAAAPADAALEPVELALPPPVDWSHAPDQNAAGGLDPGQTLHSQPPPGPLPPGFFPLEGLDIAPTIESGNEPDVQIDALSQGHDALFELLLRNQAELLFSTAGDGFGPEVAAWSEAEGGAVSAKWHHVDLDSDEAVDPQRIDDVDALEVWGPGLDAIYFSIPGDRGPGVSIFRYDILSDTSSPFLSHAAVVAAVQGLGYGGSPDDVDLDAMLVRDTGTIGLFEAGDAVLFSIRETPGADFDGGEIVLLEAGQPAVFLQHGGHTWDKTFSVSDAIGQPQSNEEVDALEAAPGDALPVAVDLTFEYLPGAPPVTASGSRLAVLTPLAPAPVETLALFGGGVQTSTEFALTDPPGPPVSLSALLIDARLGSGSFAPLDAAPLTRRVMPVRGFFWLCRFATFCTTNGALTAPLTRQTSPYASPTAGLGVGGVITVTGGFPIQPSFRHAPWTVGTATVSYTRNGGQTLLTATRRGFVHGPLSATSSVAQTSGVVQLVTATQVSLGSPFAFEHAYFTTLTLHFAPEPGAGLLLGSGALGLALLARGRRR